MTRPKLPLLSLAVAAAALASAPAFAADVVTSPPTDSARSPTGFWTPERKAAARPMPLLEARGEPVKAAAPIETGEPGSQPGNLSAAEVSDAIEGSSSIEPQFPGDGSDTIWYDYPPPYDSYHAPFGALRTRFPLSSLGKLFFTDGVGNYVCSAQSVTSSGSWGNGNRQTVVTAGHCCSDGAGSFFYDWLFEPAHHDGAAPLGSWSAYNATVYSAWHQDGDSSVDYCVLQMYTLDGESINDAVGALGYSWNQPLPQQYTATGWPAASPYTGGRLILNHASDAETDTAQAGLVLYTHGIGNPMTGGSSGGAWIDGYNPYPGAVNQYFNGLNSYKYTTPSRPLEMFGPYVEDLFVGLLEHVATQPAVP